MKLIKLKYEGVNLNATIFINIYEFRKELGLLYAAQ